MSTTAENELRKVYKDHNLHVLFGVTSGQVELLITVFTLPGIAATALVLVMAFLR